MFWQLNKFVEQSPENIEEQMDSTLFPGLRTSDLFPTSAPSREAEILKIIKDAESLVRKVLKYSSMRSIVLGIHNQQDALFSSVKALSPTYDNASADDASVLSGLNNSPLKHHNSNLANTGQIRKSPPNGAHPLAVRNVENVPTDSAISKQPPANLGHAIVGGRKNDAAVAGKTFVFFCVVVPASIHGITPSPSPLEPRFWYFSYKYVTFSYVAGD
jgi:hypothetical protein